MNESGVIALILVCVIVGGSIGFVMGCFWAARKPDEI